MTLQYDEFQRVAFACADAAASITLPLFRQPDLGVSNKEANGFDPVTKADKDAELAIRKVLAEMRPDDGILGEEYGHKAGTSGLEWVLDPIDGTRGFVSGTPTWGTLISIGDENGPLLGLIDQPYIGERFYGANGKATLFRDGKSQPIRVRETTELSDAIIFTTFPEVGNDSERAAFHEVASQTRLTRYGMDCYAYALLAAGQIDLVIEAGLHSYDIHAPIAVIEGAGGIVTNWQSNSVAAGGRAVAAATPQLHEAALTMLSKVT